jgi:putative peptide zinc metalloprotease protein
MDATLSSQPAPPSFRPLRNDLRLLPQGQDEYGAPVWTIHDLSRNSFFRIGWMEFEILTRWRLGNIDAIVDDICQRTPLRIEAQDVENFMRFMNNNQLLVVQNAEERDALKSQYLKQRKFSVMKSLKYYIFFKVALVRPDPFLNFIYPKLKFIFSKITAFVFLALFILAVYLILREWEAYTHTFTFFFTAEGVIASLLTLIITQTLHEMGHALLSRHYGLRVPSLGIGFIVMFPFLYTDTTSAWKLQDKHKRLLIGMSGVITELGLAIISTIIWAVLPEGIGKSVAFTVSSLTWIMSVAVNFNPLMKFDGYYMFSDLLGVDNLQDRAFAYAKWFMRNKLLGLGMPPPEFVSSKRKLTYILYAYATWIYRFFLFLGIAIAVYHYYFKLLGITLFCIEIVYFLGLPILKELSVWWKLRPMIKLNINIIMTLLCVGGLLTLFLYPWQNYLEQRAVIRAEDHRIFAPSSAKLSSMQIQNGEQVKEGQILFTFQDPKLDAELEIARTQLEQAQMRVQRTSVSQYYRGDFQVEQQGVLAARKKLEALEFDKNRLNVTSPGDGVYLSTNEKLHVDLWVPEKRVLGRVISPDEAFIETYVSERDLERISTGRKTVFYSDMTSRKISGHVIAINETATTQLEHAELSTLYGGDIPSDPADPADKTTGIPERQAVKVIPREAIYRVIIQPDSGEEEYLQVQRGWVEIAAEKESLGARILQKALSILIREAGF